MSSPRRKPSVENKNSKILSLLIKDLKKRSENLNTIGIIILLLCITLAGYLYFDIQDALNKQILQINNASSDKKAQLMTIYLIFRTLTLGSIPTALLIFGYNIVKASFDQSVRFAKRKHGALFWQYLLEEYRNDIKDITFEKFKDAFEAWNKTTESSFTNFKVSDKNHFAGTLENMSKIIADAKNNEKRI